MVMLVVVVVMIPPVTTVSMPGQWKPNRTTLSL
jgi:hypothetical protein